MLDGLLDDAGRAGQHRGLRQRVLRRWRRWGRGRSHESILNNRRWWPEGVVLQEEVRVHFRVFKVLDSRVDGHGQEAVAVVELVELLLRQNAVLEGLVQIVKLLPEVNVVPVGAREDAKEGLLAVVIQRVFVEMPAHESGADIGPVEVVKQTEEVLLSGGKS